MTVPLNMTSDGWRWPEVMLTTSSRFLGDVQQRASSGQVDEGYRSTLARRRRHYSCADEATGYASGVN